MSRFVRCPHCNLPHDAAENRTVDLPPGVAPDEEDPTEVSDSFVFADVRSPPATAPDYEGEPSIEVDFEVPPYFEAS